MTAQDEEKKRWWWWKYNCRIHIKEGKVRWKRGRNKLKKRTTLNHSTFVWCGLIPVKVNWFWWCFDVSCEVVIINCGILYTKQKFKAYRLIWMHQKHKFCFHLKSRSSEGDIVWIAFWGFKSGSKTGKALPKRLYRKNESKDYPYTETYVKVKKISNWLDISKNSEWCSKDLKSSSKHWQNTCASMVGWFRGVHPYKLIQALVRDVLAVLTKYWNQD